MQDQDRTQERTMIRHALATLAYRGGKALAGATDAVAGIRAAPGTRSPLEILAHINDLLDWSLSICRGTPSWQESTPQTWDVEAQRFHRTLAELDQQLSEATGVIDFHKLLQGPILDAFTHVGQISLLRRIAGSPVRGENYFVARITVGKVGADQPAPVREFD